MDQNIYPNFCPYCGTPLQGEGKFCMQCGSPIAAEPAPQPVWESDATQKWNMEATQKWDATQESPNAASQWDIDATQQINMQTPEQPEIQPWPVYNTTVAKTTIAEKKAAGKPPKDKKLIALIVSICSLILALGLLIGVILLQSCNNDADDRDEDEKNSSRNDRDSEEETEETEETEEPEETEDTQPTQELTQPTEATTLPEINLEELVNQRELTFRTEGEAWHLCIAGDIDYSQIRWSTSDPTVVTVNETGTVTAVGKGTATITAIYEDQVVECVVLVEGGISHAEFMAAQIESQVTVDCYVQAVYSRDPLLETTSLFAQTPDGGYFIYNMGCTEEEFARLTVGTKIRVTGTKAEFCGQLEILNATVEILDNARPWIAETLDATELLGTEELKTHMSKKVSFTGMTIEHIEYKNEEPGDDIYLTVSYNGMLYYFCVEVYLTDTESEVYKTVCALSPGDVVDIVGFLHWFDNSEPYITEITVQ